MRPTIKKRKPVKHTRFPNGFGSISFLKGNRRRPYWVKKTTGYDERGYPKYLTIGYYETFEDAFVALCEYNNEPYDIEGREATFENIADKWQQFRMTDGKKLSESTVASYRAARAKCKPLFSRKIKDITVEDLQQLVSAQTVGVQGELVKYIRQVFRYAMRLEVIKKDPSVYVHKTIEAEPKRNPFTVEEVRRIWEMPDTEIRNKALIMLYTGMRVGEFATIKEVHETYIIAGEKTEAGRNRMIPLHTKIRPLMMKDWNVTSYRPFVAMFPGHTPHDCRRTFISRCVECGVDPVVSRKIVGHSGTDVHEKMYTFLNDPDFLCREIEKICY